MACTGRSYERKTSTDVTPSINVTITFVICGHYRTVMANNDFINVRQGGGFDCGADSLKFR